MHPIDDPKIIVIINNKIYKKDDLTNGFSPLDKCILFELYRISNKLIIDGGTFRIRQNLDMTSDMIELMKDMIIENKLAFTWDINQISGYKRIFLSN